MTADRDAAARTWVEHLRGGGTTTWHDWATRPGARASAAADPGRLPGAAQLELLRQINSRQPLPHLVGHVLHRPGPGRGRVHLGLDWPPPPGPAASHQEVLRVATGVLADLTTRLPTQAPTGSVVPVPPRRRAARSFVLDGLPVTVAGLRAELTAAGLTEHRPKRPWFGGRGPDHPDAVVLVVGPVADSLREVWSRRVQEGSGRRWPRFVGAAAKQGALPGTADHLRTVERWVPRVGSENIHVVTSDGLRQQVAGLLDGSPSGRPTSHPTGHLPGDPVHLTPLQQVVLRRVNSVLPFLVAEPARDAHRAALVALMSADSSPRTGPARLAVPVEHQGWVAAAGVRLEQELRRAGCTVHGELAELHRPDAVTGDRLRAGDVLDLMVRMIHRVDAATALGEGGRR